MIALSVPNIFVWDCRFVSLMTLRSNKKRKKERKEKRFLKFNMHNKQLKFYYCSSQTIVHSLACPKQRAKKVVSDSPGLVDFAIGLVIFVFNLLDGQVLFDEGRFKLQRIVINSVNQKGFGG